MALKEFLNLHGIKSQAKFIQTNGYGYGQVEPNHLSAQRTSEVYAQLPAAADIDILEQGQFAKYDYAAGVVDFEGPGEWMLVYNEIKLYRDPMQMDCEFAMIKDNYQARVYSPFGYTIDKDGNKISDEVWDRQARYLNGVDAEGNDSVTLTNAEGEEVTYKYDDVTGPIDPYEIYATEDPFHILNKPYKEARMPEGTTMVPRLFKTHEGDIFTTNMINAESIELGDILCIGDDGILCPEADAGSNAGAMRWQVVKVYTMPDHQPGVKVMRIV